MLRRRPEPEERGPRGPRGMASLEQSGEATKTLLPNTVMVRMERWLTLMATQGLISSPMGVCAIIPHNEILAIAGRDNKDGYKLFTCTQCPRSTTNRPTKDMRYTWPPPEDWFFGLVPPNRVPSKFRKRTIALLVCPECHTQQEAEEKECAE